MFICRWFKVVIPVLLFTFLFFTARLAFCKVNVAVDLANINLDQSLQPGGFYPLPQITVINSGDEQATFAIEAAAVEFPGGVKVDELAGWFRFNPSAVSLEPGESADIEPTLFLPHSAAAGKYNIRFRAAPVNYSGTGLTIVPVAETRLKFEVFSVGFWDSFRTCLLKWLASHQEAYLLFSLLLLSEAVLILRRNFQFSNNSTKPANKSKTTSRYKFG